MANLTRRERRWLTFTGNAVRMYVAVITFVFALQAVKKANVQYHEVEKSIDHPPIPRAATYGTIVGIYLPMFAAVSAYLWATRAYPEREQAPHGFGMALFRDLYTFLVVTVLLYLPAALYGAKMTIQSVNTLLVWYQTVLNVGVGGAFAYYFHASLAHGANGRTRPARTPRRPRPQRAAPADAAPANATTAASDGPASA